MNSCSLNKCEECSHITNKKDEFCYMFRDRPEALTCGQHDKYKAQRAANGKRLLDNPALFVALVNESL